MLRGIPCVLMRGGSSKGVFFLASSLPGVEALRNRALLAAMGSPDVRQIDGLGGGDDQSSKVVLVAPSQRPAIDVEYLFAQVSVSRDLVDVTPNSGNMAAGVAPFAIEQGLVAAGDAVTLVRIFNLNTGKVLLAEVQTPGGQITYKGDYQLDGVPGTSSPVILTFLDPSGGKTGEMLPTGAPLNLVDGVAVSCVDFTNPLVFVAAGDVGKSGHESKQELDADAEVRQRLEQIRRRAGLLMGMGDVAGKGLPKMALLARPRHGGQIASRYFVPETCHAAHALTGALCLAAACNIPGTIAAQIANPNADALERLVIEHPSGHVETRCSIEGRTPAGLPIISRASIVTSARPLFTGTVYIRDSIAMESARAPSARPASA